ncbi:ShlB/FhaC/HecB family hemolysin secretion/activation protein [Xenorhabdus bovienii]|nr:ShlB/FhaC/HecB family hemolysin secretion/activation protein [Xenorhabdus bovienii]MDE9474295.1 ShlB/FhaC/HecB family hemolysin secretion/activation protein [Xenorhabdus bovienii]
MFIKNCVKSSFFYLIMLTSGEAIASPEAPLPSSQANTSIMADQEIIKQRQKEVLEESQKQQDLGSDLKFNKSKEPEAQESKLSCQIINDIVIEGATIFPKSKQKSLIEQNISKCLTQKDIESLLAEISNYYMIKGYITSGAFIKPRSILDISRDNFTIQVIEGKINNILLDGENLLELKMAFPNMKENILNLRDIEQGLDQLNRLPSYQVKIDIRPSDKPGYSDVILKKDSDRLPISVDLSFDNNGQKNKGNNQFNTSLQIDNLLHLADSWTFYGNKDTGFSNSYRSWYFNTGVSIPYGYWLFNYQYSKNESYQNIVINDFGLFRYMGKGNSHSVTANRTLYRDGKQKLSLNMGLTKRKTENILGEYKLASGSDLSTVNLGFNYSSTLLGGYFRSSPTIVQGLHILGATKDNEFKNNPKSKFTKLTGSLSYYKPITQYIYYFTSVYGQYSPKNLYSSERMSIGGLYSVRGFKEQYVTGNSGGYWRNEVNWKVASIPKLGDISLVSSLDAGWLKEEIAKSAEGDTLVGTSLGLNLNNKISNHSITLGKPLKYSSDLKPDNWVFHWSTSFNF